MLSGDQLVEFKQLFAENKINTLYDTIWSNMSIDYDSFPQTDYAPDLGDFLVMPDIKFNTICNVFNVLYDMVESEYTLKDTSDDTIKTYLFDYIINRDKEDNTIVYCIQQMLKKEWDFIIEQDDRELINRINNLSIEDVEIVINNLEITISGYVRV